MLDIEGTTNSPSLSAESGNFQISGGGSYSKLSIGQYLASPYATWMQTSYNDNGGYTSVLSINPLGGNVGIGTTGPSCRFKMDTDTASNFVAYFVNSGNNVNRLGLAIQNGTYDNSGTNEHVRWIDGDGDGVGTVTSSGGTVTYGAFTANHDVSVPEQYNEKGYPYGTLMCITSISTKPEQPRKILYNVEASKEPYASNVLGAYAGKIDKEQNLHQVYVLGDGHIRVNGGGVISIGDPITTSSTEGVGMKATKAGMIIGYAQENHHFSAPDEEKLIAVQYGLSYYTPQEVIQQLNQRVEALEARIRGLEG